MVMSEEVLKTVQAFIDDNGNKRFTNKELIIYFNKKHEKDIEEIKDMLNKLPCVDNEMRLTRLETTNKIIAGVIGIVLIVFGLIISFVR